MNEHLEHEAWLAVAFRRAAVGARAERLDDYRERAAGYDLKAARIERSLS